MDSGQSILGIFEDRKERRRKRSCVRYCLRPADACGLRGAESSGAYNCALLSEKGSACAIDAIAARLEDEEKKMRSYAVAALRRYADRGDSSAVSAVSARLSDHRNYVRLAAVNALAWVAQKTDQTVRAALSERLFDEDERVRRAAALSIKILMESE